MGDSRPLGAYWGVGLFFHLGMPGFMCSHKGRRLQRVKFWIVERVALVSALWAKQAIPASVLLI